LFGKPTFWDLAQSWIAALAGRVQAQWSELRPLSLFVSYSPVLGILVFALKATPLSRISGNDEKFLPGQAQIVYNRKSLRVDRPETSVQSLACSLNCNF